MTFFFRRLKKPPKRLLISRTDRIGDFVLTLPVFKALSEEFDFDFSVLCQEMVTPLLDNNPYVNDIITISKNSTRASLIDEIQSRGFDTLLVLVNDTHILNLLPKLKFITTRIGPISKPSTLFHYTHPALQKRSKSLFNEAQYNLDLLRIFGIEDDSATRPEIYFKPEEITDFKLRLQKIYPLFQNRRNSVVLHAGMQGSALNWSTESYCQLLASLLSAGHQVILTGASDEEKETNKNMILKLTNAEREHVLDLSNQLSLRELAILTQLADLFIGPSTGPTHIANAAGTPLISFYPKIQVQSQKRWEPFMADSYIFTPQSPCNQKFRCIYERCSFHNCMDEIDPGQVFAKAESFLSRI
ncbi:MAG: glycosyltransferase family 9 protein [Proteobacteria bacterium]|nr:glycosyltransferase family 9 protein [Pseudomonadota bacterium]